MAITSEHASDWLNAIPVPSLGLKLDNASLKVAAGLRLGARLCHPYQCVCGAQVNTSGRHGLSCKLASGRHPRHSQANAIIKRALGSADFPSTLEPSGVSRTDGKRPDGMTHFSFKNGKPLVWDFTCSDTVAASNLSTSVKGAGKTAEKAEDKKIGKYQHLQTEFHVVPIAVETFGAFGPNGLSLLTDIGKRIVRATGERQATAFLFQSLSMAVQRGNSASILGTVPVSEKLDELYYM